MAPFPHSRSDMTIRPMPAHSQSTFPRQRHASILVSGILGFAAGATFLCNIVVLSGMSWPMIGLMLCVSGTLEIHTNWQVRGIVPPILSMLAVTFYLAFGLLALLVPTPRLTALALIFFMGFFAVGTLRSYCGYALQPAGGGWRWLIAGGGITMTLASYLMVRWPYNGLEVVGQLLALDLLVHGLVLIGFSLPFHRPAPKSDAERQKR